MTIIIMIGKPQVSWSHKQTTVNFNLGLVELAPLPHIWKLFFINFWGVVCTYKYILKLSTFCWVDKMSCVNVVSFCNLIGNARVRWCFPRMLPSSFFPPFGSLGMRLGLCMGEKHILDSAAACRNPLVDIKSATYWSLDRNSRIMLHTEVPSCFFLD